MRARIGAWMRWTVLVNICIAGGTAWAQQPGKLPATRPVQQSAPAAQSQQSKFVFSGWTKLCSKAQQPNAKEACQIINEARLETGRFIGGADLIEVQGEPRGILRLTLPFGIQIKDGTRATIDQGNPMTRPYVTCVAAGCFSDYEADADLINKLKNGKSLMIQASDINGQVLNLSVPLADFAKAHEGPATDPQVVQAQQKKLREELERRAEAQRKQGTR